MKIRTATTAETADALLNDLRALVSDAEKMLNADGGTDGVVPDAKLRTRFTGRQGDCADIIAQAKARMTAGAKCTDATIRANPYQALAIALGTGLLVGMLVGRPSS